MDAIMSYLDQVKWDSLIFSCLRIVLILGIVWFFVFFIEKIMAKFKEYLVHRDLSEDESIEEVKKRVETLVNLLKQALKVMLWVTSGLVILKELNIPIAPILASAGVLGVAIGFGTQSLVKDVICGFFVILENQLRVGDVGVINGVGGLVERITLRTIILRDLSGTVHVFPNGSISTLSNLTKGWSAYVFDVGVAYKEDIDQVIDLIKEVGREMKNDEKFGQMMIAEPEIFGLDKLADSSMIIKGRIRTKPIKQWDVGREFLRRIKYKFDEHHIEIPFPQRTIHIEKDIEQLEALTNAK